MNLRAGVLERRAVHPSYVTGECKQGTVVQRQQNVALFIDMNLESDNLLKRKWYFDKCVYYMESR